MHNSASHRLIRFFELLPTGKIRILVSLGMSVYVVVAAIHRSYTPTVEILGFLLISQGIDVTQYTVKQKLAPAPDPAVFTPPAVPSPGKPDEPVVPTQPTNISDLG